MMTLREIKTALRSGPYAWPGGYPLYFIAADGEPLAFATVKWRWRDIVADYLWDAQGIWRLAGVEVNWEDSALYCSDTGARVESAYAEPEDESQTG